MLADVNLACDDLELTWCSRHVVAQRWLRLRRTRTRHLRNDRVLLTEASRLFERVRYLQHTEIRFVAADYLHPNRKSFGRKATRHRGCRIARCRDIPAGFHPVDVAIEPHTRDLCWVWRVDIEWRQLGGR